MTNESPHNQDASLAQHRREALESIDRRLRSIERRAQYMLCTVGALVIAVTVLEFIGWGDASNLDITSWHQVLYPVTLRIGVAGIFVGIIFAILNFAKIGEAHAQYLEDQRLVVDMAFRALERSADKDYADVEKYALRKMIDMERPVYIEPKDHTPHILRSDSDLMSAATEVLPKRERTTETKPASRIES